jgi:GDP-mannose 6-dehydrogenase
MWGLCRAPACLSWGHQVIGVDTNPIKVRLINDGQSPVVEEGIDELIKAARDAGQLRATCQREPKRWPRRNSRFISVATPSNPNQTPDLGAVDCRSS